MGALIKLFGSLGLEIDARDIKTCCDEIIREIENFTIPSPFDTPMDIEKGIIEIFEITIY